MKRDSFDPAGTLWSSTTVARSPAQTLNESIDVEVAVIGGGFTGLSSALHLAQSGRQVALFEAFEVGHRASGRNGGQVVPGFKPTPTKLIQRFGDEVGRRMIRFGYGNADYLFDLVSELRIDCAATRQGWIQGAFSPASVTYLEHRAREINAHGGDVEYLSGEAMFAATGSRFWQAGLLERRAGAVHPLAFTRGLAHAAAGRGVAFYEHSPVSGISEERGATILRVGNHVVRAARVIVATDAYTGQLWPSVAQSYVTVASAQIATEPLPESLQQSLMSRRAGISETRKITYYCRLDPDGRFVIGGRGRAADHIDPATEQQLRTAALARFPQLEGVRWEHRWACRVGMTIDDLPRVHELAPGIWTAYGYCGRGVAMATALGRVLADAVNGVPAQSLDFPVTPLRRIPFFPARQVGAALAINWYRLRDALGHPA
ncbi:NAD(P)/FAD-dependent oxidoreductase [Paraburkholderia susongensis]|uniref:Glycine/D-amino acid oxidase n=1 Tax=Paraburkholderia susongensis TaxID=1515439 RepID=A0A1X7LRG3_9BURK|nr:FAD-binding oxidoreductase [Paraburkholderia susongensis]SMG55719.1 Glycine/D-amino acid oxidase [Paraburkholderia susongensis]